MARAETRADTLARLRDMAVVPVIRTPTADLAERVADWLAQAGMRTVEITLTTPGALDLIRRLRTSSDLLVGAGTLRHEADAVAAIYAGAHYLVSPARVAGMAARAADADVACVMGAYTPSEVLAAHQDGADAVKVFPVGSAGGPSYVKALRAVFPDIAFAPTGGITPETVADYLRVGCAFVGVGGRLVDVAAVAEGRRDVIEAAARAALASVTSFRNQESGS